MKRIVYSSALVLLFSMGCQKTNQQLVERIAQLEKRIEVLEKRLSAAPAQPPAATEQTAAYDIPVGQSYVSGNPTAALTLAVFSDYQCPFCSQAHDNLVTKVLEDPELKDKVKVVFKHFPLSFHKMAKPASKAALAAGEQGSDCFWALTKKLYAGQRELTDDNFKKWASETTCKKTDGSNGKLDAAKFWTDYTTKDADYEKAIQADVELGMNKAQVRGTPAFYVNGWKLGQRSVESVKQLIKEKNL